MSYIQEIEMTLKRLGPDEKISLSRVGAQGAKGDSVSSVTIDENNHLIITIVDGTGTVIQTIDAGDILAYGIEINEVNGFQVTGLSDGEVLTYDLATGNFINESLAEADIQAASNTTADARNAISATGGLSYNPTTGVITLDVDAVTFEEVLAADNSSGPNNLVMDAGQRINTDTINETSLDAGVTIEGVNLKDNTIDALNGDIYNLQAHVITESTLNSGVQIEGVVTKDGLVEGRNLSVDGVKLDGIESGATADQTASEIRVLVDAATDSNVFTDADHSKLDGIESGATADQTAGEIKTLYESNANTNAFTDAEQSKLSNIEANADVTDAANVDAAGAVMNSDTTTAGMSFVINDDTMATASDTTLATSDSIKQYVLSQVSSQVSYQGGYNATTNTPDLDTSPSGITTGDMYTVTAAGTFFATALEVGDVLIAEQDNPTLESHWTVVNKDLDASSIKTSYESNANTNAFTDAEQSKLSGIESGATADQTASEIRALVESATDSNVFTDADHTKLNGIESGATADQTASEIRTLVEAATDSNVFTDADHTKLNGIESGAQVNDPTTVLDADIGVTVQGYSSVLQNTTASYTTAEETKLAGIESGATADQTDAEIRAAVEAATDSNVFTDADHSKLNGIEAGADVTDATNVAAAGAVMDGDFTANGLMRRNGSGSYDTLKYNEAITNPTVSNDNTEGYSIGSRWINTSDDSEFVLVDASTGAAVWKTTALATGAGALIDTNNLSDLTNTTTARQNLGVEIGVDVQAYSTVLQNTTASYTTAEETKLAGIESGATADQTAGEIEAIVNHDNLLGFVSNEHLDWTADLGATNIHVNNITGLTTSNMSSANVSQFTNDAGYITATLSNEEVQDIVGGMLSANTETDITVTYQDIDGTIDFVVNNLDAGKITSGTFADARISQSSVTQHQGAINHDALSGFVANEHIDWTADQGVTNINNANITGLTTTNLSSANVSQFTNDAGYITQTLSDEQVQDKVGAMLTGNTETDITVTYQDIDGTIDFEVNNLAASKITSGTFADARISQSSVTQHQAAINHDALSGFVANEHIDWTTDQGATNINNANITGLTTSNLSSANISQFTNDSGYITSTLTNEEVQDIVGAMVSGNTETDITVTYQDIDGTIDFSVNSLDASKITTGTFADARISQSSVTQHQAALSITESQISDLQAYALDADAIKDNVSAQTISAANAALTINSTSGNSYLGIDSSGLNWSYLSLKQGGVTKWDIASYNGGNLEFRPAGGSSNVMSYSSAGNLNVATNITLGGTVDGRDVAADGSKLDGIESGATADQTAAEIRALVESATDSNVFTDADHSKLNGIESGATADQTKADIDALNINADTVDSLHASSFVRSDANDSMSGVYDITSGSTGYSLKLGRYSGYGIFMHSEASATHYNWFISSQDNVDAALEITPSTTVGGTTWDAAKRFVFRQSGQLDVPGAIVVGGTVDGRDVAADGSKLDGIESGATADQTAGEIEAIVNHDNLIGFVANEHINWTADQGATNINNANITGLTTSNMSSANISQFTNDSGYITATLTNEQVQDIVGAMVSTNTETDITVTYQDIDGTIDFEVNNLAASKITSGTFADARISQSSVTQHQAAINHDSLSGFVANEHIDWTADQGATNINNANITGLTTSNLNSANISQFTNDSGYVTEAGDTRAVLRFFGRR